MIRHQLKSQWYYIFWGAMAIAVVGGQVYVGSGYRTLSKELRAFSQAVYDQQMGWGPRQQAIEKATNSRPLNKPFEFE
jgi:hypothetical protein